MAAPVSSTVNPTNGFIFPKSVPYRLNIMFDQDTFTGDYDRYVSINDEESYSGIEKSAEEELKRRYEAKLIDKNHYLRQGSCKVIVEGVQEHAHSLASLEDWESICKIILLHCVSESRQKFRLDISREFAALQSETIDDESIMETKRVEIYTLLKSGESGEHYLPQPDIIRVASFHTIQRIIEQDKTIDSMDSKDKESLAKDVQKNGKKLLLSCILAKSSMKCLKHILDAGYSDDFLPLEDEQYWHPTDDRCRADLKAIIHHQKMFMAPEITSKYMEYCPSVVMPIQYPNGNKKSAYCGSGAYSEVYRIQIDPNHHKLSKDRNAVFALKIFRANRPLEKRSIDFKNELKILEELRRYPHDDMVTHLAAWKRNETYYMLFPCAECNLREYMKQQTFDVDDKEAILRLLTQLRGLAHALRDLHNFADIPETGLSSNSYKSGWHHDIKPENILFFPESTSDLGTLRIADFGLGRISEFRSRSAYTRTPTGTSTYEPPEAHGDGARSRPYDIWSLGCVFLELLVWAHFGHQELENFAKERKGRRAPESNTMVIEDDAFWQMKRTGETYLRLVVKDWMDRLRDKVQQQKAQPFRGVLKLVEKMLSLDRTSRITAIIVLDTLERINNQMKVDLSSIRTNSSSESDNGREVPLPRLSIQIPNTAVLSTTNATPPLDTARQEDIEIFPGHRSSSPTHYDYHDKVSQDSKASPTKWKNK